MPLTVISRDEWGARVAKHVHPLEHPVTDVVCTHTRTSPCYSRQSCRHFIKRFQKYFQAVKKKLDIPYNFLVGFDGAVYEGRGWHGYTEVKYYLPKGHNVKEAIHIALIGDFEAADPDYLDSLLVQSAETKLLRASIVRCPHTPGSSLTIPGYNPPVVAGERVSRPPEVMYVALRELITEGVRRQYIAREFHLHMA